VNKPELKRFMDGLLSSNLLADAVVLFRHNPGLIDTVEGIGRRLGVSSQAVGEKIDTLRRAGILRRERIGRQEIISYDSAADAKIQEQIGERLSGLRKRKRRRPG